MSTKNEITIAKTYGVEVLDKAITEGLTAITSAESSNKSVALAMATLRTAQKNCEKTAKLKFPVWVESVYNCKISGQSMYKYAQIALAFSASEYWDVFSLSKLSILMNTRTKDIKDAPQAVDAFAFWYGDTINQKQLERHAKWLEENAVIMQELENATSDTVKDALKAKLTKEPKDGVAVPPVEDKAACDKYYSLCVDRALDHFAKLHDAELSDIVKAYRNPEAYFINDAGKGEKYADTGESTDSADSADSTEKPKTPDELKADAYTALLAYVSASGDDNKTFKNALRILGGKD